MKCERIREKNHRTIYKNFMTKKRDSVLVFFFFALNLPLNNFHKETSEFHRAVRLDVATMMDDNRNLVNKFHIENRLFYSCDTRLNDCQV